MSLIDFLHQFDWYELVGGFLALCVMSCVAFYTTLFIIAACVWYFISSHTFRVAVMVSAIGGSGWFLFHLIHKYGA